MEPELARQAYELGKDARDWKVVFAQEDLRKSGPEKEKLVPILYRPFDVRWTYYTGNSRGFHCMPRGEVMHHMLRENIGLICPKRVEMSGPWAHALVTNEIIEHVAVSLKTIDYLFPLYIYPDSDKRDLFTMHEESPKTPNFSGKVSGKVGKFSPEEILAYIYAVLYSETYRAKYAEFLKTDFPRIPFTKNDKLFRKLAALGSNLQKLHLMDTNQLGKPVSKFQGKGDGKVEKPYYEPKPKKAWINEHQCFEGVPPEVWQYRIGGYQVCDKWLKDRKGRVLRVEDIQHYCRIVTALAKTLETQDEIDKLYNDVEGEVHLFNGVGE
jgi:predicted helicase